MIPTWSDIRAAWSEGWQALAEEAVLLYASAIEADPGVYAGHVSAFQAELATSRATLDRLRTKLPNPPATPEERAMIARYAAMERRWNDLAAGLYAEATPAGALGRPTVGVAPAVLIVGSVAITAVGVSWAIAAYEYAVNLREQTALAEKELDARVTASRDGRTLPPTTLPPPPPPLPDSGNVGLWLLGGLAVVTGALVLPPLLTK